MDCLEICVLGPLVITQGQEPVTAFESDKIRALLAYLVVEENRPHPREKLAEFFWPDRPASAALSNLRHALTLLRRVINDNQADPPYLLVTRQVVQFNNAADVWVDVHDFVEMVALSTDDQAGLDTLEKGVALVRGPFLEGLSSGDSIALEEWILFKRQQYDADTLQALKKLAAHAELTGEFDRAICYARKQIEFAPWEEQAHQHLMRLLALGNRQSEALAQFEICRRQLADELNVRPSPETIALYEWIQTGGFKPPLSELHRRHIRGYELGECIGMGHVGAVYRAYQPIVAREVAIKIILPQFSSQPDFIRRFESEARMIARLEHPHIVPLYDYWRDPNGAYLVMRWLRKGSLEDSMFEGPWPVELCVTLVDQISTALATAHLQGVIHQDIKPANILLDESGNAYLSDFGIAIMSDDLDTWRSQSPSSSTATMAYQSPEAAHGGELTAATDIYSLGVVIFVLLTGKHPWPNLSASTLFRKHRTELLPEVHSLQPNIPSAVDEVIQQATAKNPGDRFNDAPALAQALRKALNLGSPPTAILAESRAILSNPYRGLLAFQEADAQYFFGREHSIQQLVNRLRTTEPPDNRFLAIVGPSGSGKSSVIRAGLLPALRAGAVNGSENWYIAELSTGIRPQENLNLCLLSIAAKGSVDFSSILDDNESGLQTAVDLALSDDNNELLLIIDQFESLFDSTVNPKERDLLLAQICAAVKNPKSRIRFVVGLRADFYDRPLGNPCFGQLLGSCTVTIGSLSNEELIQAIEGPAKKTGVALETGLTNKIMADMSEQSGALPMLQYALTELFEHRRGSWLNHEAYRSIGGISGALVQRAEALYCELDREEQQAAKQLFLRLVSVGDEADHKAAVATTRRRVLRSELESLYGQGADTPTSSVPLPGEIVNASSTITKVIEAFGTARLLTFDRDSATRTPTVEVVHDALLWEWPRLGAWLDENRDQLLTQRLLAHETQEWLSSGQDSSFLLQGTRLDQFERWRSETDLAIREAEQIFLDASLKQRASRIAEDEARRKHEEYLEQRSRTFLRALAGVLAAATAVAFLLMLFAFGKQREALEAYSLSLIANAQQAIDGGDTATGLVLVLAANDIADPPLPAQRMLNDVAFMPGARQRYQVSDLFSDLGGQVTALEMSPDDQEVLLGFDDGTIVRWDWHTKKETARLSGHDARVNDIAFGPEGRMAISGADDGHVIIWDMQTGEQIKRLAGHAGPVKTVDISSDGQWALSGGYGSSDFNDPGQLMLWEMASGLEILRFDRHKAGLIEARFVLDDSAILASSGDAELLTEFGTVEEGQELRVETMLWDVKSGELLAPIDSFGHDAFSLAISSDGQQALIGSYYDNVASLVDLHSGETLQILEGHHDGVSAVHMSANGLSALTGSHDGSLILWDLLSGDIKMRFKIHSGQVADVVTTSDNRVAFSTSSSGELIRWDLSDAADMGHYTGHGDMVYDVAYHPDGDQFLSISGGSSPAVRSQDTSVRLWDVDKGEQIAVKPLPLEVLFQIEVTPDGKRALIAGMSPEVLILDASTLEEIGQLAGHDGWVTAVDISSDGHTAVTASVDGSLIEWDLNDLSMVRRMETEATSGLWSVAIGPDNGTILADNEPGTIGLWDLVTGERINSYAIEGVTGDTGSSGYAFLPDGQSAIAQDNNGLIYQWDLRSGELMQVLGKHNDIRTRIEIASTGDLALSSGMDGVLMLWDLKSGELIRRFGMPGQMIFDVDMSPSGKTALSGLADGSIVRWRLDNLDNKEVKNWIAANRVLRDLSCNERDLYQIKPYCEPGDGQN